MNPDQHIEQAIHNERLARLLLFIAAEYTDWALTAIFYTAVHLIDASCVTRHGLLPAGWNRYQRRQYVRQHLRPIRNAYEILYRRSVESRYDWHFALFQDFNERQNVIQLREQELRQIKDHLRRLGLRVP